MDSSELMKVAEGVINKRNVNGGMHSLAYVVDLLEDLGFVVVTGRNTGILEDGLLLRHEKLGDAFLGLFAKRGKTVCESKWNTDDS
ncbi:MAG: hypothetical protein J0L82_15880 [Deltaproteobacteria bacterium]|nr:hypothetical protein [Deltaproteobacteria bacterium]